MHGKCRFWRFWLSLLFVLAVSRGASADEQPAETGARSEAAGSNAQASASQAAAVPESALAARFREFEVGLDAAAGWLVGKLASVMFYDVGRHTITEEYAGVADHPAAVEEMIERLKAEGLRAADFDYTLTLPAGATDEAQRKALGTDFTEKFTPPQRSFSVAEAEAPTPTGTQPVSRLTAVRHGIPLVVLWLVLGAVFFTFKMNFISLRGVRHAISITAGKYDDVHDAGEVSHFQALTAALSATVGLGNIAGVAIAIMTGGPGATFWMIMAGFLGMSSKFAECTLGQKYREVRPDGRIMGGAMFYLSKGLGELGLPRFGKFLAVLFAILCIGASFGGGNAFQVNQSLRAIEKTIPWLQQNHWAYGLFMVVLTGIVIIGGIRRIASTAEKIVPAMCGIYLLACVTILAIHIQEIPRACGEIFAGAFTPQAGYGGLLGVLVLGFKRAAFSNEAGVGSAAIAHSAAKTEYPIREGIVALLEPFIDTVVICTMTALVIVVTGVYARPDYAHFIPENNGAGLTSNAMGETLWFFPPILSLSVFLFAYSTMISWSYYGERCWVYLFGDGASMSYRILFLIAVFLGSIVSATNILDLSDLMILGMAFPNILGVVLLSGKIKRDLDDYWRRYKSGEFDKKHQQTG